MTKPSAAFLCYSYSKTLSMTSRYIAEEEAIMAQSKGGQSAISPFREISGKYTKIALRIRGFCVR